MNERCINSLQQDILVKIIRGEVDSLVAGPSNPTNLPDEVLDTCTPIMVIRHPAMQTSSVYQSMADMTQCRPGDEDFETATTLRLSRALYDFLCSRGKTPIVVDAEDMLWRTQDLATNICGALNIDAKGITDKWDPVPIEKWPANPVLLAWTEVIWKSSGIERPTTKPAEPTADAYYKTWVVKYGVEVAEQLKGLVQKNMPHYEYLKRFKV
ncbi:hypothetical protein LTR37_016664 [Vermiconidia calcicola]|uniref:Uncharacterized protein n=1 Tax=Vermiconidia calcicola TaxID=1690605 RepID=A0ACC3MN96_9PEZI|nr:hypothetical protein LTR37_016664 [Vermiconidia calcicola]